MSGVLDATRIATMAKEDASDAPSQHAVEFPVRKSDSSAALEMIANVNEAIVRRSQSQRLSELQKDTSNTEAVEAVSSLLKRLGGTKPITSVLISNNGLAAVKFIRSVRRFALKNFGDERVISLVAMATPEDMRVGAEHIRMADQIVEVPGGSNNNNYANVRLIVEVAQQANVDAVWPGWGHASEFPELPASLNEAGITFLGPPAAPMAALGDKVGSTILAQAANVPTLAWSGTGVAISYEECDGVIPDDIYEKACIRTPDEAAKVCGQIGYPVMLKASWGGGGKGIRKVYNDKNVPQVFKQVQAEVPGSPIFAMKLAPLSRHLEVQLLADRYGNVAALFSRDCSIQRRHQKIVEEGPVTVASPEQLKQMEVAACNLARSVGYVGAATVEYLYLIESGEFCFLELNPRLQVEHPVTEWISNVDIPACQLLIGMGVPLWRIPDIRRHYQKDPYGEDFFKFEEATAGKPDGHVVAVRLTSEDANDGFKPTSGSIDELSFRSTPDVWGYFSVKGGGGVHEYADSQFGHLFAKGETRTEAIKHMLVALADIKIRGEIRTTVDYVMDMLQSKDFVQNTVSTSWLDARIEAQVRPESPTWYLAVIGGGVSRAYTVLQNRMAEFISYLEKGQIPSTNTLLEAVHDSLILDGVKYSTEVVKVGPQQYCVKLNSSEVYVVARALRDGGLLLQMDGKAYVVHTEEIPLGTRLLIGQKTCLIEKEQDPSKVVAVTPGKLVRWLVEDNSHVNADEQYAEIEVMKMIMPLVSNAAGVISFEIAEGQQVAPGQLIARIKLDDESSIKIAKPFQGKFPKMGPPMVTGDTTDQRYNEALQSLLLILAGYEHNVEENISKLLSAIDEPKLAIKQWHQAMSAIKARLPQDLVKPLETITKSYENALLKGVANGPAAMFSLKSSPRSLPFPSEEILNLIDACIEGAPSSEQGQLQASLEPIISVAYIHEGGREAHASRIVRQLLEKFLIVEEVFNSDSQLSDIIEDLRVKHKGVPQEVLDSVVSHQSLKTKCKLIYGLLSAAIMPNPQKYRPYLRRLAALESRGTEEVALRAKHLLEHSMLGDLRSAVARSLSGLEMFHMSDYSDAELESHKIGHVRTPSFPDAGLETFKASSRVSRRPSHKEGLFSGLQESGNQNLEERMKTLVQAQAAVEDPLASLLDHPDSDIQWRAVETYIRRIYNPYLVDNTLKLQSAGSSILATWCYFNPIQKAAAAACNMPSDIHFGMMVVLHSLSQFPATVTAAAVASSEARKNHRCDMKSGNIMHIALIGSGESVLKLSSNASILFKEMKGRHAKNKKSFDDDYFSSESDNESFLTQGVNFLATLKTAAASAVAAEASLLESVGLSTVSFVRPAGKVLPQRFGFVWSDETHNFEMYEQSRKGLWQVEPPIAKLLDLRKLRGLPCLYCPSRTRQWHLFVVTEKTGVRTAALRRVFLRGIIRKLDSVSSTPRSGNARAVCTSVIEAVQPHLTSALEELVRAQFDDTSRARSADWAHVYLSILPSYLPAVGEGMGHAEMAGALRSVTSDILQRCGSLIRRTAVSCLELRLLAMDGTAWRICVSLQSGFQSDLEHIDIYREAMAEPGKESLRIYAPQPAAGARPGPLAGCSLTSVYEPLETLQRKRLSARRLRTTYCYDFPVVFETALRDLWAQSPSKLPSNAKLIECEELVLNSKAMQSGESIWNIDLVPVTRSPGQNDIGMIAWLWTLRVPEKPEGRQIIVIANDASHGAGSFGPKEDAVFKAATELGLKRKLPIIYLCVNSGARFGLAEEVRKCFRVAWVNESDPSKGFQYLYLEDADYQKLKASVKAERFVTDAGERRWILSDIIGCEDGLGVECLSGSGAIATAYSRAYNEGFTLTFVTGRAIGIGAYLARLGHRVIQRIDQPIILTGYAALNKLLGRQVYTSHMQLGGPKVMGYNGVSHALVDDDITGAQEILRWLSYVPCTLGGTLPEIRNDDPVEREITYAIQKDEKLSPSIAIAGKHLSNEEWVGGLFDKGSWSELQGGWAKTVLTGHARLGGIPAGVVAVEVDTVSMSIPADPGDANSSERTVAQAGQVWFPDSALKTAQAIEEFNKEGLPLFILANWRGFSGGMSDLFNGVLQNGARIVEALRVYKGPVYIYLPPGCELRGGAWAVLDTKINPERIEMYADNTARGGVLEPEGMVEIKYRDSLLFKTMHRLDPVIKTLKSDNENESSIASRQQSLLQGYRAVAVGFADMHDGAERMHAKGIIRNIVPWKHAREFFYWRLKKHVVEGSLMKAIATANESATFAESRRTLHGWFDAWANAPKNAQDAASFPSSSAWKGDVQMSKAFVRWSEADRAGIDAKVQAMLADSATVVVKKFMHSPGAITALVNALKECSGNDAGAFEVLKETRDKLQELLLDEGK